MATPATSTPAKRRKPNWTADETLMLMELINERKKIIKGKFGPNLTSQDKKKAWSEIAPAINAANPLGRRTSEECERRWFVVQSKSRKTLSEHYKKFTGTGKE